MKIPKRYLGDGVFVEEEAYLVKLTTNDGGRDTNTIYLEPDVWLRLQEFMCDLEEEAKERKEEEERR